MKLKQRLESIPRPYEIMTDVLPDMLGIRTRIKKSLPYQARKRLEKTVNDSIVDRVSAQLANNPGGIIGYAKSLHLTYIKKKLIEEEICNREYGNWDSNRCNECRFTVRDIQNAAKGYEDSLVDYKIAERHANSQVQTGDLDKDERTGEYIWRGYWKKLAPVL